VSIDSVWPRRLLWIAVIVLVGLLGVARVSATQLDDDTLWLAYASAPAAPDARAIEGDVLSRVTALPGCEDASFRLGLRQRYASNYAGYLAVNTMVYQATRALGVNGATAIVDAMLATKALLYALAVAALLWACVRTRDQILNLALALGLTGLAAADVLSGSGVLPVFSQIDLGKPATAIFRMGYSLAVPSHEHSMFGLTPRNAALALFALAMVLRWRNKPVAAAVAVLLMSAAHLTYGGIGLFLFAATTSIAKPTALSGWTTRAVLVLAAVLCVARDRYFGAGSLPVLPILGAVVVMAAGLLAVGSPLYARLRERILGRFADREVLIDVVVLLLACVAITAIAIVGASRADPVARLYLWSDLAMRIWSFARFPMAIGAALLLLSWIRLPAAPRYAAIGAIAAVAAVVAALQIDWSGGSRRDDEMAAALVLPGSGLEFRRDETPLYAHLALIAAGAEPATIFRDAMKPPMRCDR
jgi:hypothetical protein